MYAYTYVFFSHWHIRCQYHYLKDVGLWAFVIDGTIDMFFFVADMPAFQSCVEKGRVSGLMCSLNAVNGTPAQPDDSQDGHYCCCGCCNDLCVYVATLHGVSGPSQHATTGVPACADDWLLNEVARKDWGFAGNDRLLSISCCNHRTSFSHHLLLSLSC